VDPSDAERVRLYRSVSPEELADIEHTRRYRLHRASAGKRFFFTFENASRFSKMVQAIDPRPYTVTSVVVDVMSLVAGEYFAPAREGNAVLLAVPPRDRPTIHTYTAITR
jgi:hypothetical protein